MPTLLEAALVERPADGADAAVHHVRRRDEVGAGDGVRQRRLRPDARRSASLRISSPSTMPQWPCEVYSQRHTSVITTQVRHRALERAHRASAPAPRDRPRAIRSRPCSRAGRTAGRRRRRPPCAAAASFTASSTDSWKTPGIEPTSRRTPSPSQHEQRVDEAVRRQPRLADQRADRFGAAQPPRTMASGTACRRCVTGIAAILPRSGQVVARPTRLVAAFAAPATKCAAIASTRPATCTAAGCTVTVMPSCARRLGGHRADGRDDGVPQQIRGLIGAVDLGEVPHGRRARERHDVDASLEQHAGRRPDRLRAATRRARCGTRPRR